MTKIECEHCDRLDHATVTQDEAREHELEFPNHEVTIQVI